MKNFILSVIAGLALMVAPSFCQTTTMTTVQNGPPTKTNYVTLPAVDENGAVGFVHLDNRVTGTGPSGYVSISSIGFTGTAKGSFTGFGPNPNGTHQPFAGQATYFGTGYTPDGRQFQIFGVFNYHAVYNNVNQGRTPTVGWYYSIDAGSVAAALFPAQQL